MENMDLKARLEHIIKSNEIINYKIEEMLKLSGKAVRVENIIHYNFKGYRIDDVTIARLKLILNQNCINIHWIKNELLKNKNINNIGVLK